METVIYLLISRSIEKYKEHISVATESEIYGVAPQSLIIEYYEIIKKRKCPAISIPKSYVKGWNYSEEKGLIVRDFQDKDERVSCGMYFDRAHAHIYYNQENNKAYCDLQLGPRYARGYSWNICNVDDTIELKDEKIEWLS